MTQVLPSVSLQINGQPCTVAADATVLQAIRSAGLHVPTLCHLDGLTPVGACRLCLVALEGHPKLEPACVTTVAEGMVVRTHTPELESYRRMAVELFFAEGNHVCAFCVANGSCELQDVAVEVGMDHSRFPCPVWAGSPPLHPLHPLRADVRRDRRGARMGCGLQGQRLFDHCRPRSALGRGGSLHLLRQVRGRLPHRRPVP